MRPPRCILFDGHQRCRRRAARRMEDLYACASHGLLTVAMMAEGLSAPSRRMLAFARWNTYAEGKRLIDRLHQRKAAA